MASALLGGSTNEGESILNENSGTDVDGLEVLGIHAMASSSGDDESKSAAEAPREGSARSLGDAAAGDSPGVSFRFALSAAMPRAMASAVGCGTDSVCDPPSISARGASGSSVACDESAGISAAEPAFFPKAGNLGSEP